MSFIALDFTAASFLNAQIVHRCFANMMHDSRSASMAVQGSKHQKHWRKSSQNSQIGLSSYNLIQQPRNPNRRVYDTVARYSWLIHLLGPTYSKNESILPYIPATEQNQRSVDRVQSLRYTGRRSSQRI